MSVANLLGVLVLALGVGLGVAAAGPRLAAINSSAVDIQRTEGARRSTRRPFDRSRMDALGPVLGTSQRLQRVARLQFLSVGSVGLLLVLSLMRAPSAVNLLAGAVVCAGAWQVPLILARRQSQALAQAVDRELGDALGELVMGVEAGLTLEAVMTRYADRRTTPLAIEFEQMVGTVALGGTRNEALMAFERRCPTRTVKMFTLAVAQNQSLGTPLAAVFRQQAVTIRRHRRQAAEADAAKLSMKMIFPTIFCILPVLMIVVVGPAVIRLLEVL